MEEEHQNLESFLTWAAQLGISDSTTTNHSHHSLSSFGFSLSVSHFPHSGGRGLGAVRDLKRGELILRVPKSALMTRDSVMEDKKLCFSLNNKHSSLSPTQILTVCLLYEMGKGKTSRWHPYLVHLPQSYDILATFGEFEKHALQVDEAVWVTEKAVIKAKSEWKEAQALMEELKLKPRLLTFKAWVWAAATISSRTLHVPWDEAGCLCPVGDLFNYDAPGKEPCSVGDGEDLLSNSSVHVTDMSNGGNTMMVDSEQFDSHSQRLTDGGFEEDANAYCFYARAHYKKGDQVLLCYGTYTNLELLEHYGFLLHENPNDKVFIPLEPAVYSSSSWSKESLYIHHNGRPSFALLAALRLWATPQNKRRSVGHLAYAGSQLSPENEISIMKRLSETCYAVLQNMLTCIDDDNLLLNAIDCQDFHTLMDFTKLMSSKDEIYTFLEAHDMKDAHSFTDKLLSKNTTRCMDRWKLAVQWRVRYKKVLVNCISYCNEILDSFMK
ncbi:putative histone-lysine N-methyltransferase chromatin remodeling SET family [Lupinus albus]|uniref:Putative histone-lysine N-methyltransferase chromatin remodeling SET family n=1 Tax=Lupinus albus TaxID=3870 RepID=A0A6A4QM62_LUPAL|nr:putative histone-lysine N-methyltransferase chromatin remodeling SET family [Lupinus albus]